MSRTKRVDPETQQVELCRRLREEIILGHLPSGLRITEKFISERMSVKRGPARESLLILEGQGLVRKVPSLGYFIESHTEDDVRDVYAVRQAMENLAVRRAAVRATREHMVRLELICDEEAAAIARGDEGARLRADLDFHEEIVRSAQSRVIDRTYASIARPIYGKTPLTHAKAEHVAEQHRAICAAIRARDPERASALLLQHIGDYSVDREPVGTQAAR